MTDGTTNIIGQISDLTSGDTAQFRELNFVTDIAIVGGQLALTWEKRKIWCTAAGTTGNSN